MRPRYSVRYGLQPVQSKQAHGVSPRSKKGRATGSWDISAVGSKLVAITPQFATNTLVFRAALSLDGRFLYWASQSYADAMFRVKLQTPFMVGSADFSRFETIFVPPLGDIGGFSFSPDGRYFVAMQEGVSSSGYFHSFRLGTPWDLKSAVPISSYNYGNTGGTERFLGVVQNGTRVLGDYASVAATMSPPWRDLSGGGNTGLDTNRVFFETPDGKYRFSMFKNSGTAIRRERLANRYGLAADETVDVDIAAYDAQLAGKSTYAGFCFSLDGRFLYLCLSDRSVAQIRLKG